MICAEKVKRENASKILDAVVAGDHQNQLNSTATN